MTAETPEQDRIAKLEAEVATLAARGDTVGGRLGKLLKLMPWLMASHFLIGAPALMISVGLAYFTFVQAEATKKMQQADTWPFISYGTSNVNEKGERVISLSLANNGVGPAMLGPIEIRYQGQPVRDARDLLTRCCGLTPGTRFSLSTSPATAIALPARESTYFMRVAETPESKAIWNRFETERWKLQVRSCYCSIFDECWTIEGSQAKPKPVAQCPTNWTQFRER